MCMQRFYWGVLLVWTALSEGSRLSWGNSWAGTAKASADPKRAQKLGWIFGVVPNWGMVAGTLYQVTNQSMGVVLLWGEGTDSTLSSQHSQQLEELRLCSPPLCAPTPLTSGNLGGHPDSSGLLQDATGLKLYSHGFLELDLMQPVRETLLSCEVYSHIFYSKKFFLLIITSWLSSFYLLNYMGVICETLI